MVQIYNLEAGMSYTLQKQVTDGDTSLCFGRRGIELLLSTTALMEMMIEAAVLLVGDQVQDNYVTVSKNIQLSHIKPTLKGMTVTVKVVLEEVSGNVLKFSMVCYDELGEVASGSQERHIVHKNGLINRARKRAEILDKKD